MDTALAYRLRQTTALGGCLAALLSAGPALAQSAPSSADNTVTEIIVTAEKREARLLTVPAPVTALAEETLNRQSAVKLEDYAAMVPGLNVFGARAGDQAVVLRGISTGNSNSTTTAVYINDTPVGGSTAQSFDSAGLDVDPATLQRIEVLRGPQGTLYGANALGGIVKYVTRTPSLTDFTARVQLDGTSVEGGGLGGAIRATIDGPIIKDKLGFTLSAFNRTEPGYIDNPRLKKSELNQARTNGVRLALQWRPTDKLTIDGSITTQDNRSGGSSEIAVDANLNPIAGRDQQFFWTPTPLTSSTTLYSASVGYDLGWAKVLSITSYEHHTRKSIADVTDTYGPLIGLPTPPVGLSFPDQPSLQKMTQEIRIASTGDGPWDWQGGFYFTHERGGVFESVDTFNVTTQAPIDPVSLFGDKLFYGQVKAQYVEYAAYADVTYHFTPQFEVQVGARESTNRQTHNFPSTGLLAGGTTTVTGGSEDSSFTYLVTPKYTFNPDHMVYARIASGYRPGGPNNGLAGLTGLPTTFDPDTLTNYEIGYKGSFLDRSATLDVSLFDIEWKDIQILETVNGISQTGNGAAARSYGFEGAAAWVPVHGLNLGATLALTNAKLTEDAPGVGAKSGERLPYSPKVVATLTADYRFPLGGELNGFVGASYHYVGDRKIDFQASAPAGYVRPSLPSYDTVNLRAGVEADRVEVAVFVKNVGDSRGLTNLNSTNIDGVSAQLYAGTIQPRTYGVTVTSKF